MKTQVTPAIIAASVVVLLIAVVGIYKLTMGNSPSVAPVTVPKTAAQHQQQYMSTYAQDQPATPQAPSPGGMSYGHGMGQ